MQIWNGLLLFEFPLSMSCPKGEQKKDFAASSVCVSRIPRLNVRNMLSDTFLPPEYLCEWGRVL